MPHHSDLPLNFARTGPVAPGLDLPDDLAAELIGHWRDLDAAGRKSEATAALHRLAQAGVFKSLSPLVPVAGATPVEVSLSLAATDASCADPVAASLSVPPCGFCDGRGWMPYTDDRCAKCRGTGELPRAGALPVVAPFAPTPWPMPTPAQAARKRAIRSTARCNDPHCFNDSQAHLYSQHAPNGGKCGHLGCVCKAFVPPPYRPRKAKPVPAEAMASAAKLAADVAALDADIANLDALLSSAGANIDHAPATVAEAPAPVVPATPSSSSEPLRNEHDGAARGDYTVDRPRPAAAPEAVAPAVIEAAGRTFVVTGAYHRDYDPATDPRRAAEAALLIHVATGVLPENQTPADVERVMADPMAAIIDVMHCSKCGHAAHEGPCSQCGREGECAAEYDPLSELRRIEDRLEDAAEWIAVQIERVRNQIRHVTTKQKQGGK